MNRDARRTGALGLLALLVGALSIAPPTGVEAVVTFGLSSNYVRKDSLLIITILDDTRTGNDDALRPVAFDNRHRNRRYTRPLPANVIRTSLHRTRHDGGF